MSGRSSYVGFLTLCRVNKVMLGYVGSLKLFWVIKFMLGPSSHVRLLKICRGVKFMLVP